MPNPLSPILSPLGLDPSQGYDTAAQGARDAQKQANALSDLQWQRQMAGLQQAQGAANQFQSLFNSVYGASPGYGMSQSSGAPNGANMLLPKTDTQAPKSPGLGGLLNYIPAYQYWQHVTKPAADAVTKYGSQGLASGLSTVKGWF